MNGRNKPIAVPGGKAPAEFMFGHGNYYALANENLVPGEDERNKLAPYGISGNLENVLIYKDDSQRVGRFSPVFLLTDPVNCTFASYRLRNRWVAIDGFPLGVEPRTLAILDLASVSYSDGEFQFMLADFEEREKYWYSNAEEEYSTSVHSFKCSDQWALRYVDIMNAEHKVVQRLNYVPKDRNVRFDAYNPDFMQMKKLKQYLCGGGPVGEKRYDTIEQAYEAWKAQVKKNSLTAEPGRPRRLICRA